MRVCVRLPDALLSRALIDMLRAHGHEASTLEADMDPCTLRIVSAEPSTPASACSATLILRRGGEHTPAADPEAALLHALDGGGIVVWDAPMDPGRLLRVLRAHDGAAPTPPSAGDGTPDLTAAPYAWITVDPRDAGLLACNAEARVLLGIDNDAHSLRLADLPLGGGLRHALGERSEGLRTSQVAGQTRIAAWWTDGEARRVACFLPVPSLQHSEDRAGRALARLGQMAATLAHEIRNPVASLAGALDLLENETDPGDRAEVLEMAHARLKQLSRLLEKTLSLARPIEGPAEIVEVQAVIQSAVGTMRHDPHFEHVTIEVDVPQPIVRVSAFEGPLLQALINLLLNAAQAQDGHGRVRITLTSDARRALLRVHDDGPGIPPDKRRAIFRPFYTTKSEGTGLGLAEVRRAMEAGGGAISVEDVDEGACVQLELPLAPPG